MCHKLPSMRRICNDLLAERAAAAMCVCEKLLCARFNRPDFVLMRAPPSEAVIHPMEIYVPDTHTREKIRTRMLPL